MLASLTACQNSNDEMISTPVGKDKIEKSNKATAREGEELPPLSPEEEKAMIEDAVTNLRENRENEIKNKISTSRYASTILCHTDYLSSFGTACVWNNGYLVTVTWQPQGFNPNSNHAWSPDDPIEYTGTVTNHCNC